MVFHMVGDTGGVHGAEVQEAIAEHMESQFQNAPDDPAFYYNLGDVVYFNGLTRHYNDQFYEPYQHYPARIFAIPGNHDGDTQVRPGDEPDSEPTLKGFVTNFCDSQPHYLSAYRPTMTQPYVYWTLDTPLATIIGLYSNVDGLLDGRGTSAACLESGPLGPGPGGSGLVTEQAMADMQQFPGLANAQHRQLLQVSPAEMLATGVTNVTADSITLHLEGTIGAIPYNLDIIFALDLQNDQLVVTLKMMQPIPYEGSWTFKLHRLSLAGAAPAAALPGTYMNASLVATSLPNLAGGIIGCIIKCVGPELVSIVVQCLPSLIGGKEAFFACLIQRAGSSLPKIVQCIQQCK